MMCSLSKIDGAQLEAIKTAERKIGKTLLAFSCRDIKPAELTGEELTAVKAAEEKTGLVLVAVRQ